MRAAVLLGRLLFSAVFIVSSFSHFSQQTIQYAADHGVPFAGYLVPFAGVIALVGGISVFIGLYTRVGAALLMIFLVPVTIFMHNFWDMTTAADAQLQGVMFLKNMSMLGGAIMISYFGPGPLSLDMRRTKVHEHEIEIRKAA